MSRPVSAAYLERKIRAITGLSGSNPLPDLEALQGLLVLESDRPEWALPGGELLVFGGSGAVAGVGEFSYVALDNPADSGVLIVVEHIRAQPDAAGQTNPFNLFVDRTTTVLAGQIGSGRGLARDFRAALPGTSSLVTGVGVITAGNDATPSATMFNTLVAFSGASTTAPGEEWDSPIVIPPSWRIVLVGQIVNNRIAAGLAWRERPLEGQFSLR